MSNPYVETVDDGLPMRDSNDYAKDKLRILEAYIHMFIVSMQNKNWRALNYIDLQAGPGKNHFTPSNDVMLGSPLIALSAKYPFTNYWFVELDAELHNALTTRVESHEYASRVTTVQGDCNVQIDNIIQQIEAIDREFIKGVYPSLNLAFLDPEGLELRWETVEKLARMPRMDLIINFSTSGFTRNVGQWFDKEEETRLDRFFGTPAWREVYKKVAHQDKSHVRRAMIDFYLKRLSSVDANYNYNQRDIIPPERVFKNTKGVQVYTLIAASKHRLGNEFWQKAINRSRQRRLF